jgi:CHAT domain-containing protein/tetratricopeptide (TPR) repeat protein
MIMEDNPFLLQLRPTTPYRKCTYFGSVASLSGLWSVSLTLVMVLWLCLAAEAQTAAPGSSSSAKQEERKSLLTLSNVERELNGGESHVYRIGLKPGQFLCALVEQKGIDVVVTIFGPDGRQAASSDSPNDQWGTEPILLIADKAGDYQVKVGSPNSKAPTGRYEIRIVALREATLTDRDHVRAEENFEEGQKLRSQQTAASRRAAIEKYNEAVPLFQSAGDSYRQALTLLSIGLTHAQLNEFRVALPYFNQTLTLARTLTDRRLEAATETFLGGMDYELGNPGNALDHFNQALTLSRTSGNVSAEATALNNIGNIYNDLADWQRALDYYRQSLPLHRSLSNQRSEARTLQNIGVAYQLLGEPQEALHYFQESLLLNRSLGEKNREAEMLTLTGSAYYDLGDLQKAFEFYDQALKLQRDLGNRGLEAGTLDRIGRAYSALGQPKQAIGYVQQALQLRQAIGDRRREAISLSNVGYIYNLLGQSEKAQEQFEQALTIFRSIGDLNSAAIALEGSARTQQNRGNLEEARKRIEESLNLIDTVRARSGSQQLRASYFASMEKAFEFYIDLLMKQDAKFPSQGHDAEALQASERAHARSLTEMLNEARVDVRQGVDAKLIERERNLGQAINAKAQRQIQLKAQKGNEQEIAALDKEIRAFEEEYQRVQVAIRKSSPQYAALTQPQPLGLKEIQQQLDQDTLLLEYSLGEERSYVWAVTPTSLKTYELPKRDELRKVSQRVYELLTTRSLSKSLESAEQKQQRIAQADSQLLEASRELSGMIISPVASQLGNKRLVIVADGALQYVPFAMLPDPSVVSRQLSVAKNNRPRTTDNVQPLIVDHEIVSLPSASALAVQRQSLAGRKLAPKGIAMIADPVFSATDGRLKTNVRTADPQQDQTDAESKTRIIEHLADSSATLIIPRLQFTREEADQILAVAPKDGNLKAIDFKASRAMATSVELSQYRYVHFATHGYLDSDRPDLSAVVLSLVDENGKPQDGFLRAHDIYNLNLPAELVVLSACQTGLGKEIRGEGLVGLTQGFMYAGARRVLVSLWNVNDKATAELMQRFYRHMLKDHQSPAASLRAAQVEMWGQRHWQSPYYWAAFTMQGEWR